MSISWKALARAVRWNVRPFVGGGYRSSASTDHYDNIDPATEAVLCGVPAGAAADVDEAVLVARRRFDDGCWSELPPARRAEVLRKLAELVREHSRDLALLDSLEMGRPVQAALADAAELSPLVLNSCAGYADQLLGVTPPLTAGTLSFNTYEPRGVVGAITPWNFPAYTAVFKIAPALAAGNTIVLKPSEVSPSSALKLAELAVEAGVPEGVFNVVPGLGTTAGAALALHPDVDLISFTGSTAVGRKIMEASARSNNKPMLLECGGKSPNIVFGDADDLDRVADETVRLAFWNQGQWCAAHTRLLVEQDIKDALLERVVNRSRCLVPGDPLDERTTFGPLASRAQCDRVRGHIEGAVDGGARAVLEGRIHETGGCFVAPTIFDRVESHMPIVREEVFGPVLCVQTFTADDEAIALANGTDYALAATVWTRDAGRAKRMAHAIKAAGVTVRTSGEEKGGFGVVLGSEPRKASGFGAEMGLRGLESYSALKRVSFVGV